jgi:hypothetical protein
MSHFCVAVIGEDIEEQLQPYHEYECTGNNDQYVRLVPLTDEDLEWGHRCYVATHQMVCAVGKKEPFLTESEYYVKELHWEQDEDQVWCRLTNPDSRWDWWTVGGRWTGFFTINEEVADKYETHMEQMDDQDGLLPLAVDSASVEDLDFMSPRMHAEIKASKLFDDFTKHMEGIPRDALTQVEITDRHMEALEQQPDLHGTLEEQQEIQKRHEEARSDAREAARAEYYAQPWQAALAAFCKEKQLFLYNASETYFCLDEPDPRFAFITKASDGLGVPHAYIHDGQWHEQGQMGMWGTVMVGDETTDYENRYWETIQGLEPGTQITIVDCHV